jgi:cyanophycinase-like exopeptidase
LENTITDGHFAKRDRMGRTLVFLARIMQDGWSKQPREVAIDEKSAVLVEADGRAAVVGSGRGAYFLRPTQAPGVCREKFRSASAMFLLTEPRAEHVSTFPRGLDRAAHLIRSPSIGD